MGSSCSHGPHTEQKPRSPGLVSITCTSLVIVSTACTWVQLSRHSIDRRCQLCKPAFPKWWVVTHKRVAIQVFVGGGPTEAMAPQVKTADGPEVWDTVWEMRTHTLGNAAGQWCEVRTWSGSYFQVVHHVTLQLPDCSILLLLYSCLARLKTRLSECSKAAFVPPLLLKRVWFQKPI